MMPSSISREVEVRGIPIAVNYVDVGESSRDPVIVLVHGLGQRWQYWSRVIPAISRHRRVLAMDLPGFGDSPLVPKDVELSFMADAVAALLAEVRIESVVFVGHSFGGLLATTFGTMHSELTAQLILVGGTLQSFQQTLAGRIRPWLTRPRTALAAIVELLYVTMAVPKRLGRVIARSPLLRVLALWWAVWKPSLLCPGDAQLLIEGVGTAGVLPTARAIAAASGWEQLPITVPVALINCDHDLIAPLADLRAYPGRVDQVVIIKGSGHVPMLEAPESFVGALNTVLDGPPPLS